MNTELSELLLSISKPIVAHFHKTDFSLGSHLNTVCYSNRLFASYHVEHPTNPIDDMKKSIFDVTDSMIAYLMGIEDYVLCGYYNWADLEYKCKIDSELKKYIETILRLISSDNPFYCDAFNEDYVSIYKNLMVNKISLEQAQRSLKYWQDAVPDAVLMDWQVQMVYQYLNNILL